MPPVKTLTELRQSLNPKPLSSDELDELFVETAGARDSTLARREVIAVTLREGPSTAKVLLAGHRGTGKSTELVKFRSEHQDRFTFVQLSIAMDGDLTKVNVEGLLVLIAEAVLRQVKERGIHLDDRNLEKVHAWFAKTFKVREETQAHSGEVGGGIDTKDSFLALLGLTATLKVDIKAGSAVVSKTVQEDENRLQELAARCGELLKEAELAIFEHDATRLVLIVEDLDKIDIGPADRLFIDNPTPLAGLPVRAVFTAPISLFCNPRSVVLDSHFEKVTMPMIKVENQDGERYEPGWKAIRDILAHRIDLAACIDDDAVDLAISMTGGVLRHLFETLRTAALVARQAYRRDLRDAERIILSDVRYGLDQVKTKLISGIGVMGLPEEFRDIRTDALYERLEKLRVPQRARSNRINLLLMQVHALVEYNGKQWHRVHPLVLEYLDESP